MGYFWLIIGSLVYIWIFINWHVLGGSLTCNIGKILSISVTVMMSEWIYLSFPFLIIFFTTCHECLDILYLGVNFPNILKNT